MPHCTGTAAPRAQPSFERIGGRVDGGTVEVSDCAPASASTHVEIVDPGENGLGDEDDVILWAIERSEDGEPANSAAQRDEVVVAGDVPEGFEEVVAYRGPVTEPVDTIAVTVTMQTGAYAFVALTSEAVDLDERWFRGGGEIVSSEQLLQARTQICPETTGQ